MNGDNHRFRSYRDSKCEHCGNVSEVGADSTKDLPEFFICPYCVTASKTDYIFSPTNSEVDKLVEDHCEPSEEIKFYDFSKPEDREQFDKDYGEGSDFSSELKKHFFRQFMNDEISCDEYKKLCEDEDLANFLSSDLGVPWEKNDMGKIPDVDYPVRHSFKKQKFSLRKIIDKVVLWWRK